MRVSASLLALLLAGAPILACSPGRTSHAGDSNDGETGVADSASASALSLARSANLLAGDLYGRLRREPGNLIFSPFSISAAVGLAYAGSAGQTREEMHSVLQLSADDAQAYAGYRSLFDELDRRARAGGARWTLANRMWVQKGLRLEPAYLKTTRESFRSELGELDFKSDPEPARGVMNRWVEEKTEKRIQELFPQGSINPLTRLVLANAIYFKGLWEKPFDKKYTVEAPFHVSASATGPVQMMHLIHGFGFASVGGARVLELPYRGGQLSMLILLPDAIDGLAALEERLGEDSLRAWTEALGRHEVHVGLPRFKAESRFVLSEALAGLGMPSAFSAEQADFSGINGARDLFISLIVHKAFVEVNEEGTEAAAATGAVVETQAMPLEPEEFLCDHPFLFLIRDRASGCVVFLGRFASPSA
jgi:serpin B